jgi:hypothetical protein
MQLPNSLPQRHLLNVVFVLLHFLLLSAAGGCKLDTVTFSHFLPHQHLLPEKRMLSYPNLVSRHRILHHALHTRMAWDTNVDGLKHK